MLSLMRELSNSIYTLPSCLQIFLVDTLYLNILSNYSVLTIRGSTLPHKPPCPLNSPQIVTYKGKAELDQYLETF